MRPAGMRRLHAYNSSSSQLLEKSHAAAKTQHSQKQQMYFKSNFKVPTNQTSTVDTLTQKKTKPNTRPELVIKHRRTKEGGKEKTYRKLERIKKMATETDINNN